MAARLYSIHKRISQKYGCSSYKKSNWINLTGVFGVIKKQKAFFRQSEFMPAAGI